MAVKEETMRESLEGKKREWGDTERVLMGFFCLLISILLSA